MEKDNSENIKPVAVMLPLVPGEAIVQHKCLRLVTGVRLTTYDTLANAGMVHYSPDEGESWLEVGVWEVLVGGQTGWHIYLSKVRVFKQMKANSAEEVCDMAISHLHSIAADDFVSSAELTGGV